MPDSNSLPYLFSRVFTAAPEPAFLTAYEDNVTIEKGVETYLDSVMGSAPDDPMDIGQLDSMDEFASEKAAYQSGIRDQRMEELSGQGMDPQQAMAQASTSGIMTPYGIGLDDAQVDAVLEDNPGLRALSGISDEHWSDLFQTAGELDSSVGGKVQELLDNYERQAEGQGRLDDLWNGIMGIGEKIGEQADNAIERIVDEAAPEEPTHFTHWGHELGAWLEGLLKHEYTDPMADYKSPYSIGEEDIGRLVHFSGASEASYIQQRKLHELWWEIVDDPGNSLEQTASDLAAEMHFPEESGMSENMLRGILNYFEDQGMTSEQSTDFEDLVRSKLPLPDGVGTQLPAFPADYGALEAKKAWDKDMAIYDDPYGEELREGLPPGVDLEYGIGSGGGQLYGGLPAEAQQGFVSGLEATTNIDLERGYQAARDAKAGKITESIGDLLAGETEALSLSQQFARAYYSQPDSGSYASQQAYPLAKSQADALFYLDPNWVGTVYKNFDQENVLMRAQTEGWESGDVSKIEDVTKAKAVTAEYQKYISGLLATGGLPRARTTQEFFDRIEKFAENAMAYESLSLSEKISKMEKEGAGGFNYYMLAANFLDPDNKAAKDRLITLIAMYNLPLGASTDTLNESKYGLTTLYNQWLAMGNSPEAFLAFGVSRGKSQRSQTARVEQPQGFGATSPWELMASAGQQPSAPSMPSATSASPYGGMGHMATPASPDSFIVEPLPGYPRGVNVEDSFYGETSVIPGYFINPDTYEIEEIPKNWVGTPTTGMGPGVGVGPGGDLMEYMPPTPQEQARLKAFAYDDPRNIQNRIIASGIDPSLIANFGMIGQNASMLSAEDKLLSESIQTPLSPAQVMEKFLAEQKKQATEQEIYRQQLLL